MTLLEPQPGATTDLPIVTSYPMLCGLQLHSLAHSLSYRCSCCGYACDSTMVAVSTRARPVCPECFAERLGRAGDTS